MGKKINTFDVVDCNEALAEAGLAARIHMHDACGGQYFSWREEAPEGRRGCSEEVRELLKGFFADRGVRIDFVDGADAFTA